MPSSTLRNSLFSRQQPGGFWVVSRIEDQPGDIWFVDSGSATGSDAVGYGRNPDQPFATLDYAIGQCTANNGDVIICKAGHTESVAAAADLVFDVAGVTVIFQGNGTNRATIDFGTDAAADMDVTAANVTLI